MCLHTTVYVWRPENNLGIFLPLTPGDKTQVVRLSSKCLYPLSHFVLSLKQQTNKKTNYLLCVFCMLVWWGQRTTLCSCGVGFLFQLYVGLWDLIQVTKLDSRHLSSLSHFTHPGIILFYRNECLPACLCAVWTPLVPVMPGEGARSPWNLSYRWFVSCHLGIGNWTQVLWKSSQYLPTHPIPI